MAKVLVTGGSGFIASHCIVQLLAAGHDVRTTVRREARKADVLALLAAGGCEPGPRLSFALADLDRDDGWSAAVADREYVLHVASPFPRTIPKDENELIRPARDGALRVLRAARDARVKRVVLTSSFASIGYGHPVQQAPFDETTWTNVDSADVQPYPKSKTLAERAAWDFVKSEGNGLELSVVNPVVVFGPVFGDDYSTSVFIVRRMLEGGMPGAPRLWYGAVDVRDVADLHLRAMTHPAAVGERFLAVAGDFMSMLEIAQVLRGLGRAGRKAPKFELPDFMVRLGARFDSGVRQVVPELGNRKNATNAKAKRVLGWSPRSNEEAIRATAESLIRLGIVRV